MGRPNPMHFGPLPIRIMAGTAFILHGYPKFGNIPGIQGFMGSLGVPAELALPHLIDHSIENLSVRDFDGYIRFRILFHIAIFGSKLRIIALMLRFRKTT